MQWRENQARQSEKGPCSRDVLLASVRHSDELFDGLSFDFEASLLGVELLELGFRHDDKL